MATLVTDTYVEDRIKAERAVSGADRFDEIWDGVYRMSPLANVEHQQLVARLFGILQAVVDLAGLGESLPGVNVSDREEGWLQNYREPDVAVILPGNPARDCGTHWCGGPDFLVEVLSPNDPARDKRPFYAGIGSESS